MCRTVVAIHTLHFIRGRFFTESTDESELAKTWPSPVVVLRYSIQGNFAVWRQLKHSGCGRRAKMSAMDAGKFVPAGKHSSTVSEGVFFSSSANLLNTRKRTPLKPGASGSSRRFSRKVPAFPPALLAPALAVVFSTV